MVARKENQSGKVYLISKDDTDNPKLVAKILADGRESLYLDYYLVCDYRGTSRITQNL